MAVEMFDNATIIANDYDLTGDSNSVKVSVKVDMLERLCYGYTEKRYQAGLRSVDADFSGYVDFDDSTTPKTVDYQMETLLGGAEKPFSIVVDVTEGSVAHLGQGVLESYSFTIQPQDLGKFDGKLRGSNRTTRGRLFLPLATRSAASGTSATSPLLGATLATQTLFACLHVTEFIGTTLQVNLKSVAAPAITGGTNRIVFAAKTGTGAEFKTQAGPITDTYYYVDWTFTGTSFKAAVTAGIR